MKISLVVSALLLPFFAPASGFAAPQIRSLPPVPTLKVEKESFSFQVERVVLQTQDEGQHLVAFAIFSNPCLVPDEADLVRSMKISETVDGKANRSFTVFVAAKAKVCTLEYNPTEVAIDVWSKESPLESNETLSVNGVAVEE